MNEQTIKDAIATGTRFGDYNSESAIEQVIRWKVCDAGKLRGQQLNEDSILQTSCRKITDVILRDYPTLTDKEFEILLEAGVSGEFGKETWVSGAIILQWMRIYNRHPSRLAIVDEQEDAKKEQKHRKTQAEIDALNDQTCREKARSAFEYYKEHGTIFADADARGFHLPQFAAIVFEWIKTHADVKQPSKTQLLAANEYADNMIAKRNTRREYIPAAHADWVQCYLLEQYYNDILTKQQ